MGEIQELLRKKTGQTDLVSPMIGPLELEDLVAAGEAASQAHAVQGRLGSRCAEPDSLAGRAETHDLLRQCQRDVGDTGEVGAERRLADHCRGHFRARVADQRRAEGHGEVEIALARRIPDFNALGPGDDRGQLGRQIELAVGATGKDRQRALAIGGFMVCRHVTGLRTVSAPRRSSRQSVVNSHYSRPLQR